MSLTDGIPPYLFTRTQHRTGTPLNDVAINRDLIKPINDLQKGVEQLSKHSSSTAGVFFVDDYGTKGSPGVAGSGFPAAVAAAKPTGGTIQFGPGNYYMNSTLIDCQDMTIKGIGGQATAFVSADDINATLTFGGAGASPGNARCALEDVWISGPGSSVNDTGSGLYLNNYVNAVPFLHAKNMVFTGGRHCIYGHSGQGISFDHTSVGVASQSAIFMDSTDFGQMWFYDLQCGGTTSHIIEATAGGGLRIVQADLFFAGSKGVYIHPTASTYGDFFFYGVTVDSPGDNGWEFGGGGGSLVRIYLTDCFCNSATGDGLTLKGNITTFLGKGLDMEDNHGNGFSLYGTLFDVMLQDIRSTGSVTGAGLYVDGGVSNWHVQNGFMSGNSFAGGYIAAGGSNHYAYDLVDDLTNTTPFSDNGTGTHKLIRRFP